MTIMKIWFILTFRFLKKSFFFFFKSKPTETMFELMQGQVDYFSAQR